jgi:phytanoyl-CoA hydroxylase
MGVTALKLTQQQIEEFNTSGFLIARGALQDADLQPVIDELSTWIDQRARQLHSEGQIEDLHADAPFSQRYGLLFAQSQDMGKGLDIMHYRGRAIFEFLHNKNLLKLIESLLGPELTCNPIQHLRAKPPLAHEGNAGPSFHNAPWHQDAGVMMAEAEASNIITCWLPIGDATQEMGCMEVLPGLVQTGYLDHQREGGTTIRPELMPDIEPVVAACNKGDVVLMSCFTPHRSTPNYSDLCRWSLDLRYQPTGVHTGRTGHPDFVVRSHRDPASEMRDYDEWCRLWIDAFENPRGFVGHRST